MCVADSAGSSVDVYVGIDLVVSAVIAIEGLIR